MAKNVLPFPEMTLLCPLGVCVCAQLLSWVWLFTTPWTVAHQVLLSMGFPRQEYLSGLPFPTPDLLDPGIESMSPVSSALHVDSICCAIGESLKSTWRYAESMSSLQKKSIDGICEEAIFKKEGLSHHSCGWDSAFQCRGCKFDPWLGN